MSNKRIPIIIYSKDKARFITTHAVKTSGYGWCILAGVVNGGSWTLETLTPEEREEFMRVNEDLTENWNYIAYNDFIRRMNAKYGE